MIWVLTDRIAGHSAQSMGLANALELPFDQKHLSYSLLAALPNSVLGASLVGLTHSSQDLISPPWPSAVIGAGRRLVPVMRYIHEQSPRTKLIQCMWPHVLEPFDLIIAPEHDRPPMDARVITTHGALHSLTDTMLQKGALEFQSRYAALPRPWIAVLIGNPTTHRKHHRAVFHDLLDLSELLTGTVGSLLITTSRRTPRDAAHLIRNRLACPFDLFVATSSEPNPLHGLLGLADAIIVTGDSISMTTEACYTGKQVFIYSPPAGLPHKHRYFCQSLIDDGYAMALTPESNLEWQPMKRLDERSRIVNQVKVLLQS